MVDPVVMEEEEGMVETVVVLETAPTLTSMCTSTIWTWLWC